MNLFFPNKYGVGQIWKFIQEVKKGDLVALPLKKQSAIAIGRIEDIRYQYNKVAENVKHTRKVKWIKTIPRSASDQDILYSPGALMTVCMISRNDAEKRGTGASKEKLLGDKRDIRSISLFGVILGTLLYELTYWLAKLTFENLCRPA